MEKATLTIEIKNIDKKKLDQLFDAMFDAKLKIDGEVLSKTNHIVIDFDKAVKVSYDGVKNIICDSVTMYTMFPNEK